MTEQAEKSKTKKTSREKINWEKINHEVLRAPAAGDALITVLLFLASRASVLGMFPFGAAFFAACYDKSIAYLGITALAVSLMTCGGRTLIVKYLIAALLYWIYTRVRKEKGAVLCGAVFGAAMFLGGLVFLMYSFEGIYDLLMLFVESVIASVMYIVFKKAKAFAESRKTRAHPAQDELVSVAVSAGVLITGLSGIVFPLNISLADIISVYAVLCIALHTSLTSAGSGGLCIGFLASMSSPSAVVMMGIFGISALLANLMKVFGRFGAAVGFIGGCSIALMYAGNGLYLPVSITEAALGAAFFALSPQKWHDRIGAFFSRSSRIESLSPNVRVKEYLAMRLEKTANAFKSLEECFEAASQKRLRAYNRDVGSIFDETAERVCDGCPNASKCWQKDFTKTYRSIMRLLETIETNGMLALDNVPEEFRERCIRTELFVVEFNHVYELYKKQLVRVGEAVASRDLVARQYREVAALMGEMADNISEGFDFMEGAEEEVVSELDKAGISVTEINIVEGGGGKFEVYLGVLNGEPERIAKILEKTLGTPMSYGKTGSGASMKFVSKAKFSVDIGIRQMCRDFSEVSGDGADSFVSEDYKQYIIISDGMGSGRRAMAESRMTLRLLHEFLMSGFGVHTAVDMINSALCLKLDYESFSTIDLVCIDLMTGVCEFFKIGSAESIVLRGADVETVFSVSLPAGVVGDLHAEGQTKKLGDGDTILMVSDGVSEAGFGLARTDWLKKEIQKPYDIMDDMADAVMEAAVRKSHGSILDDMTVAAVRLVEN